MPTTPTGTPPAPEPIADMASQKFAVANNPPHHEEKDTTKPATNLSLVPSEPPKENYDLEPWPEAAVEEPDQYRPGGFHPILLNSYLGPATNPTRFRVFHKLGFGGFGTVWLCQDMDEMRINKKVKWRVVKVMSAKASNLKEGNADLKVMEMFEGVDKELLKRKGVSIPLESFWVEGPNGRHFCLMMEWLGPETTGLARCIGHCDGMMKDICYQMLEAMEFLHSRGLCHGDFRPQNILLRLKDGIDEWQEESLLKVLGKPERAPVVVFDDAGDPQPVTGNPSVPEYLVGCADIEYGCGLVSTKIAVVDFGVAYPSADGPPRCTSGVAGPYASPEDLCTQRELIGVKSDIWSLGTAMFEIRYGFQPFGTNNHGPSCMPPMEEAMGPVPPPFRAMVRQWYDLPDETDKELQGKSDSELSYVSVNPEELEKNRKYHLDERGAKDVLTFKILYPRSMDISPAQAPRIADQARYIPRELPQWTPIPENPDRIAFYSRKDYLNFVPDKQEAELFVDMVMSIFKWKPEDRASIEQIMWHPWFEDRKAQRVALDAYITANNAKAGRNATPFSASLGNSRLGNWFNGLVCGKKEEEKRITTTPPGFLSRYVWQPGFMLYDKVKVVPMAIFGVLMILPATWMIKRRIDRGQSVFYPGEARALRHK
ncbi:kinase-like domain-containing protein [Sordaria brevicollis]|uniref:EKC/KEOPS complex subunit BUD32 n=1 Tax=Sordaria brevicollis TaxID=83679 RepID=A0AAE0UE79_SORBR|nr:kinase-like domain-containing protein [Sordaria brevicollis]